MLNAEHLALAGTSPEISIGTDKGVCVCHEDVYEYWTYSVAHS
jgi:hypothetical protein